MTRSNEISDAAVEKATGKDWAQWLAVLDGLGAAELAHAATARLLRERHALSPWWSQMVTVHYERTRGLRQVHEKPDGFEVNISRTVDLPIAAAFTAWADQDERRRWAPAIELIDPRMRPNHSIRAAGANGSRLHIRFSERTEGRTQVAVEHSRLGSAEEVEPHRAHWRSVLEGMDALRQQI